MKKNFLFYATAALLTIVMMSCDPHNPGNSGTPENPENPEEPTVNPSDAFCGTYDLEIVTDSIQNDGVWWANSVLPSSARIPTRYGRLTITKTDNPLCVNVLGRVVVAGDSMDIYKTVGFIDEQGVLQIESFVEDILLNPATGRREYSFAPISAGTTLVFKVDANYTFNAVPFIERSTNTAIKR